MSDFIIEGGILKKYEGNEKHIVIPSNVKIIGRRAFEKCESITSVTIPEGVIRIECLAFDCCENLTTISIPNSLTSIASSIISNCKSLQYNEYNNALYLGNDVNKYVIFVKPINKNITSCRVNESTKIINSNAFDCCENLTTISIPNTITSVGGNLFYGCKSLQYNEYNNALYLGNDVNKYVILVKSINKNITSCRVNESTKVIAYHAFADCYNLASISLPNSLKSIGGSAFYSCENLPRILLPDGVISIENSAFFQCWDLRIIMIPNSVISIGDHAFGCCDEHLFVTIHKSVISIGEDLFFPYTYKNLL